MLKLANLRLENNSVIHFRLHKPVQAHALQRTNGDTSSQGDDKDGTLGQSRAVPSTVLEYKAASEKCRKAVVMLSDPLKSKRRLDLTIDLGCCRENIEDAVLANLQLAISSRIPRLSSASEIWALESPLVALRHSDQPLAYTALALWPLPS